MISMIRSVKKGSIKPILSLLITIIMLNLPIITAIDISVINDFSFDNSLANKNKISKLSSTTPIDPSNDSLNPTTISVDVQYKTEQPRVIDTYLQIFLSAGEVYYFWGDYYRFSLLEASFSSQPIINDNVFVFTPAVSKTYNIITNHHEFLAGTGRSIFFGIFQAVKYTFDDIEDGIETPSINSDWGKSIIYFEAREIDCEESKIDIYYYGTYAHIWKIDLNSGKGYPGYGGDQIWYARFNQTICTNNGGEYFMAFPSVNLPFKITYSEIQNQILIIEDNLTILILLVFLSIPIITIVGSTLYYLSTRRIKKD